jgi:hypothetical protein
MLKLLATLIKVFVKLLFLPLTLLKLLFRSLKFGKWFIAGLAALGLFRALEKRGEAAAAGALTDG